jgi:PhnB protein
MQIITYIHFPGQADEAINFYKEVLGAEVIMISRMGEGPAEMNVPSHLKDKIMHARVKIGDTIIYVSDTFDNDKIVKGTNMSLALNVETPERVDELFPKLSEGGQAVMPPADTFWGSHFSMLVDKFGIHWMISSELKK